MARPEDLIYRKINDIGKIAHIKSILNGTVLTIQKSLLILFVLSLFRSIGHISTVDETDERDERDEMVSAELDRTRLPNKVLHSNIGCKQTANSSHSF